MIDYQGFRKYLERLGFVDNGINTYLTSYLHKNKIAILDNFDEYLSLNDEEKIIKFSKEDKSFEEKFNNYHDYAKEYTFSDMQSGARRYVYFLQYKAILKTLDKYKENKERFFNDNPHWFFKIFGENELYPVKAICRENMEILGLNSDFHTDDGKNALYQIFNFKNNKNNLIFVDKNENSIDNLSEKDNMPNSNTQPLNQILYGPPGTGKTYRTINKTLQIIDGEVPPNREEAKVRFKALKEAGQIEFITFHQSYGYEEFIEGIKAKTTDKGIEYKIEAGVFKRLCNEANDFNLKSIFKIDTKIGKYKIAGISNELLKLERENKTIIPIPMYLLREVLELIDRKLITPNDLNDKSAIGKMNETTEKFIINGYPNVFRDLAIHYLKNKDNFYEKLEIYLSELNNHEKILKTIEGREFSVTLSPNRGVKTSTDHSFSREKLFEISKGIYKNNPDNTYAKHIVDDIIKSIRIKKQNYILIIDEINRGNISKIFGELITLIEESKRLGNDEAMEITLPYSGEKFGVPKNLYIIGTMNTADRSIALMDTALRRRFEFEEMMPKPELLGEVEGIDLEQFLAKINQRIEYLYDRDHTIGHAYFMGVADKETLDSVMRNKVIPLLQEYFYDDWEKVQIVLGDHKEQTKSDTDKFVISVKNSEKDILGFNYDELDEEGYSYSINASFTNEAYLKIYE